MISDDTPPETGASRPGRRGPLIFLSAVGAALLLVVGLAALGVFGGGDDVDEAAWRADVEASLGHSVADWAAYRDVWLTECDADDDAFGFFIAAGLDGGQSWDDIRMNVRHACPDRLAAVEDAHSGISDVQSACDMPAPERTESQQRLAEAMGC